jgi:hypothetical protein
MLAHLRAAIWAPAGEEQRERLIVWEKSGRYSPAQRDRERERARETKMEIEINSTHSADMCSTSARSRTIPIWKIDSRKGKSRFAAENRSANRTRRTACCRLFITSS